MVTEETTTGKTVVPHQHEDSELARRPGETGAEEVKVSMKHKRSKLHNQKKTYQCTDSVTVLDMVCEKMTVSGGCSLILPSCIKIHHTHPLMGTGNHLFRSDYRIPTKVFIVSFRGFQSKFCSSTSWTNSLFTCSRTCSWTCSKKILQFFFIENCSLSVQELVQVPGQNLNRNWTSWIFNLFKFCSRTVYELVQLEQVRELLCVIIRNWSFFFRFFKFPFQ